MIKEAKNIPKECQQGTFGIALFNFCLKQNKNWFWV